MISTELSELTIKEIATLIKRKSISPVEVTEAYIRRIGQVEERVQAWVTVLADEALEAARESERLLLQGTYLGPLHGIPYGAKDVIRTAGIRTSGGSKVNGSYVPDYNAAVIERLQAAGAILLGKTTTTEFAYQGGEPPTRNPWNPRHTPGGSSSGSAAAVAAGMAAFALGTQTFGSLIRPAAYCGLTCMKPAFGRISRYGVFYASWSLDHLGAFTKTSEDQAYVLEALAGADSRDPATLQGAVPDYRMAIKAEAKERVLGIPEPGGFFTPEDPAIARAMDEALEVLKGLGYTIRTVRLPACLEEAVAAHRMTMRAEGAAYHLQAYLEQADDYGPSMREQLELGMELSAVDYLQAQRVRTIFRQEMLELFKEIDVLLTPSTPTLALQGYKTGSGLFNSPFTNTGLPSMNVPIGLDKAAGLPIGMQLIGPFDQEAALLALGHHYQQATPWHKLQAAMQ